MDKEDLLKNIEALTIYTGTYGRKKCTCSCIGCTQELISNKIKQYQGNIEQIKTIIKYLPNLKTAYILGNPDISVDTSFCNQVAKEFIKNNIKVMFSTSGYDGLNTVKKITAGIDKENIEYISFSIDTLDNQKLQYLKGNKKINIEEIEKAIKYCIEKDITVKIQPTLWEINQNDYKKIIDRYSKMGIKWFTFHAGSFETINKENPLKHIKPEKWMKIVEDIDNIARKKDLKAKAPKIFIEEKEEMVYKEKQKLYCKHGGKDLQVWLCEEGIKATVCPILSAVYQEYIFDLEKEDIKLVDKCNEGCIVCDKCIDKYLRNESIGNKGKEFIVYNKKIHNICRYYANRIKYG